MLIDKDIAFKLPREIEISQDYFEFSLRPIKELEKGCLPLFQDIVEEYRKHIRNRRDDEKSIEFPKGTEYIEPNIKLRIKEAPEEQVFYHPESRGNIPQENAVKFESATLKNLLGGNFVLVADSGMGKTTLLKELQYKMVTDELLKVDPY